MSSNLFNKTLLQQVVATFNVSNISPSLSTANDIIIGDIRELGSRVKFPKVTLLSVYSGDISTKNLRYFRIFVDIWTTKETGGRPALGILYLPVYNTLHNMNWSANGVIILRSWELEWNDRLFEPEGQVFHGAAIYSVRAKSNSWQ